MNREVVNEKKARVARSLRACSLSRNHRNCCNDLHAGKLRSEEEVSRDRRGPSQWRVKEQVAGLYAQHLARQGYITIAADAAYQGGSGGEPRSTAKPQFRVEDIHGMTDFITRYPGVDAARLGLLGICGGGGYSLSAAKSDKRFKSVATFSMFNSERIRRNGFADSQVDTIVPPSPVAPARQ